MSTGGLSKARLGRMHDVMAGHVERGAVPGLVTLVSRRGEVHVEAIGMKAVGGGYGTSWYSDPKEDMVAILMTQRVWDSPVAPAVFRDFWTSTYQAIDD